MNNKQINIPQYVTEQFTPEIKQIEKRFRHHGVKITVIDGYEHTQPTINYKHNKYNEVSLKNYENQNAFSEFNIKYYFFNNSSDAITIKDRANITTTLPATRADINEPHVLIRKEINVKGAALDNLISYLSYINISVDEEELRILKQELANLTHNTIACVHIDYIIQVKELKRNKIHRFLESLYIEDADVVISLKDTKECPEHPMSTRNINRNYFGKSITQTLEFNQHDAYCVYRYISNTKYAKPIYLYDGHVLIKLLPVTDNTNKFKHKEILEVSYSARNHEGDDGTQVTGMFRYLYTIEEAKQLFTIINHPSELEYVLVDEDKIKLEMVKLNSKLVQNKDKLADKEAIIEELKLKNSESQLLQKRLDDEIKRRERIEEEQQNKIEKAEKKIKEEMENNHKIEMEKFKNIREKRKDNMDLIKSGLALVGSVIGIFMVYKKAKK